MKIATYFTAAAFGAFWGTWGTSIPRIAEQTRLTEGEIGIALLFIAAGALPAMLLTGRAIDRWGLRVGALTIAALGIAGVLMAFVSTDLPTLCVTLAIIGASSGAADVAMNSLGGRAEQLTGTPVLTRSGAVFSSFVVLGSLATAAVSALHLPVTVAFGGVCALSIAAAVTIARALGDSGMPVARGIPVAQASSEPGAAPSALAGLRLAPLLALGALGALAFASENAHQSWSALFLETALDSGPALSALAPITFAATVAITRFAASAIPPRFAVRVLIGGAAVAASGACVIAIAPGIVVAELGLVLAAAGTATLFPTLMSIASRNVDEAHRGRATSTITVVAYLGFLLGPVYVGFLASAFDLRAGMLGVAALGIVLAVASAPVVRASRFVVPLARPEVPTHVQAGR